VELIISGVSGVVRGKYRRVLIQREALKFEDAFCLTELTNFTSTRKKLIFKTHQNFPHNPKQHKQKLPSENNNKFI
jgi:hypothetical protein